MGEHIHLQFRPSLIIFVDEAGARVRQNFNLDTLLAYLDGPLRQSVGILQVDSEKPDRATPIIIQSPSADDPDMPTQEGALEDVIYRSLLSVQLDRRRLAISTAGYSVPNPRTQVYIVGEVGDPTIQRLMAKILRVVKEQIRRNRFDSTVCYFLNCYQLPQNNDSYVASLTKKLDVRGLKWSDYEMANMSYLFEPIMPYPSPTFVNPGEIRYATAESLLALTATGIMSWPNFESELLLPPGLENYGDHIGGMSTSMIRFPRVAAKQYCSAQLSAELVQKWHDDLHKSTVSERQFQGLKAGAQNLGGRIREWIRDSQERPGVDESLWPSLAVLRQKDAANVVNASQQEALTLLHDRSVNLFKTLSYDSLDRRYSRQVMRNHTWGALAYKLFGRAAESFDEWKKQARRAWDLAGDRISEEITRNVNDLWSDGDSGLKQATSYVIELDMRLKNLEEAIGDWRQRHEDIYKEKMKYFLAISENGAWSIDPKEANIQHTAHVHSGQAKPTMGGRRWSLGTAYNAPIVPAAAGKGRIATTLRVTQQSPAEQEEQVSGNLARRADWKQKQIPSFQSLAAVSFLGWLLLAMTVAQFPLSLIILLIAQAAAAVAYTVAALVVRRQRTQDFIEAREDLLEFYRLYYTKRCQHQEDIERMRMIRKLRDKVSRARERLEGMHTFLVSVQQKAHEKSENTKSELFDGPPGVRDIFISSGERLEKYGVHTLDTIVRQVSQSRKDHPLQPWHQSLEDIKNELIEQFKNSGSLMEMTEEATEQRIHNFTANVVDGYITGSLVDISAALDKPEIWRELLDRVGKPMYDARVGVREPRYLFVCGSGQDLARSKRYIPDEAVTVQTKSSEWLLVSAFFRGGEPATVNADTLFLPAATKKKGGTPPPPPPSGGSAGQASAPRGNGSQSSTSHRTAGQSSGAQSVPDDDDVTKSKKSRP